MAGYGPFQWLAARCEWPHNRPAWFEPSRTVPDWSPAIRFLSRDPVLKRLIRLVGPCTLRPRRDYFVVLCQSIFTQQISTKVATVLFSRFRDQFPARRPTPDRVIAFLSTADEELVRSTGLSRQKRGYILDLATHFADGRIPTRRLSRMTDEQVVESLTAVNGIGRWTAEMFLIFTLNRPDVLPIDDLGLWESVRRAYGLRDRPKPQEILARGEAWRPWRTVATWYLWRGADQLTRIQDVA